ncbi:acyltransferase family protein [Aeromonas jandaei]|uniref:acyltransferase family protein n=1 Tax=Aeromonas jandaei TaxID=650 RepID=UPI0038B5873F
MSVVSYRPDIQGLRAIAVFAVMAFHLNPALLPGGFIGVDLFLVISGFLITNILLHKKENVDYRLTETLKYFYTSRFKRIAPAYFVMLVVVALVAAVFLLPQDFNTFKKSLESAAWFSSNRYFSGFGDYFAPANYEQPLLHTWSLAVEIQFYLLAPFMVLLLPVRWLKWIFAGLLIGFTALAEYHLRIMGIEQATYYSLYARLPEFFVGGLVALCTIKASTCGGGVSKWLGILGMILLIIAVIAQPLLGPFPGISALLPLAGSVFLLSQPNRGLVGKILCSKPLVWGGDLSYSLYLWHWPTLAFLRYYTGEEVLGFGFSFLFVVLTCVMSIVSYYVVEYAFRSERTKKNQVFGWSLLAVSVFSTSLTMGKVNTKFTEEQLPIEYQRYADPAIICHGQIVGDCLKGNLNSDKEILVLGDSHAAMLNHFFDYLGQKLDFKARIISASSCVTIPGFDYQRIPELAQKACQRQIESVIKYLVKSDVIFIAGSWNYHTQSLAFMSSLEHFLQKAALQKKHVVMLSQVPRFRQTPLRVQRFNQIGLTSHVTLDPTYQIANQLIEATAKKHQYVTYLALDRLPVFADAPFYEGKILYFDEHHINEIGAKIYAQHTKLKFGYIFTRD